MSDLSVLGLTIPLIIVISGLSAGVCYHLRNIAVAIRENTAVLKSKAEGPNGGS